MHVASAVRKTLDCIDIQSTAVNEVELEKIRNLITLEDDLQVYSNPAREAYSEETTNLTTNLENTFVKMEKFTLDPRPTDGQFNLEDFISDDPWIENTAFAVLPDLMLLQSDCNDTADSVLEEVIPSPPTSSSDWLGSSDELDSSFLENYIDLAAFESCSYSLNTDPVSDFMPSALLDNFLASSGQDVFQDEIPADEIIVDVETVSETDSVAVVPEVLEICMSPLDDGLVGSPVFAAPEDHLVLDTQTLSETLVNDPILSLLLKEFENSTTLATEDNVIPTTRKRSTSEENGTAAKKPRLSKLSSSSSEDASPTLHGDVVGTRRKKNNEASRVCRASRKAKHQELFEREKELISENKELTIRVEELSNMVDFCRNYLVQKLSGKSS